MHARCSCAAGHGPGPLQLVTGLAGPDFGAHLASKRRDAAFRRYSACQIAQVASFKRSGSHSAAASMIITFKSTNRLGEDGRTLMNARQSNPEQSRRTSERHQQH